MHLLINDTDQCLAQASKVAVLGAGGGIGQPLSLLLKLNPRVTELALYDVRGAPGMLSPLAVSLNRRLHESSMQVSPPTAPTSTPSLL